jgi:hypothetical protein
LLENALLALKPVCPFLSHAPSRKELHLLLSCVSLSQVKLEVVALHTRD